MSSSRKINDLIDEFYEQQEDMQETLQNVVEKMTAISARIQKENMASEDDVALLEQFLMPYRALLNNPLLNKHWHDEDFSTTDKISFISAQLLGAAMQKHNDAMALIKANQTAFENFLGELRIEMDENLVDKQLVKTIKDLSSVNKNMNYHLLENLHKAQPKIPAELARLQGP